MIIPEKKELICIDPNSQNQEKCKELSELTIDNNGTIEYLEKKVDNLL